METSELTKSGSQLHVSNWNNLYGLFLSEQDH